MLRIFRAFATSTAGPIILGLIMFAFLILGPAGGVRDVLRGHISDAVVQAGSRTISQQDFERIFNDRKRDFEQRTQQAFPLEDALKAGVDKQLVDGLATDSSYGEMLSRAGVRPSDQVVALELRRAAESGQAADLARMFNPVTGKFDEQLVANFLRSRGISLNEFQRELRDNIADQEFGSAIASGFHVPRIYAAAEAALALESRDVTFFVITQNQIAPPAPPTDAQLNALIKKSQFKLPEMRRLTIVRFSAKTLAPNMPINPADVQAQFNARQASYGTPELRSLTEIPLNDPSMAPQVAARLRQGEDPAQVARSIGVAAISYTDQPRTAITDVKAAAAAFAMKLGDVSGPIQGDFKTVILKVTKITPGQAPSLEAARGQIEADLRQQEAVQQIYDQTQKFEDARDAGASIADAAKKVGAQAVSVGPLTADGKDLTSTQPNPMLTQKLLQTAFALAQGGDSDVLQDTDKGEYYAVHVDQVLAPHPPRLDEPGVRPMVMTIYLQESFRDALQAKANAAEAKIKAGATFEAVAAENGAQVTHQVGLQRLAAQQLQQTLGPDLLGAIFATKPRDLVIVGSPPLGGMVVARVDAVHPADPGVVTPLIARAGQRVDQGYLESLALTVRRGAEAEIKPTTNLAVADTAMGADPAMLARIRPKPAKGAGPGLAQ
jgi:peptidyl-prolyl cis-trans isomerase D